MANITLLVLVVNFFSCAEIIRSVELCTGVSLAIYFPGTGLKISRFLSLGSNKSFRVKSLFHSFCGFGLRVVLARDWALETAC